MTPQVYRLRVDGQIITFQSYYAYLRYHNAVLLPMGYQTRFFQMVGREMWLNSVKVPSNETIS